MSSEASKIERLKGFKARAKFSDPSWYARGLNPSSTEISTKLTQLFDNTADGLIIAIDQKASDKEILNVLKEQLAKFDKREFDTEEQEFIADLFYELSQIVAIDFADAMSLWLYGPVLTKLMKIKNAITANKGFERISQACSNCQSPLETIIVQRQEGIPDYSWIIVRCKACNDYSIISIGANVKEVRFGKFDVIEQLPKSDYTQQQAEIRLEQIRHFRK
jgi:hypothetical protein